MGRLKAPFPYAGGKRKAAPAVWAALGDVEHYVEPFAGSLAVLLNRPHKANRPYHSETVNDADGLLVNAWRAMQRRPDETAEAASWPCTEADMHAQHLALVRWRAEGQLEHLMGDPEWCDPKMAGWWLMGMSRWIGSGYCSGDGPWVVDPDTGRMVKRSGREPGVSRQLPHVSSDGMGVDHAGLREPGVGDYDCHPMVMPRLLDWFRLLSARLRHVRIINGDWQRVCTSGVTKTLSVRQGGTCGVFVDPPYLAEVRAADLYAVDSGTVAHDVRAWCEANADDPQMRIVLAGFDGEHNALEALGWRAVEWYAKGHLQGGYANQGKDGTNQHRERLWLSPHCLRPAVGPVQGGLFGGAS